MMSTAPFTIRAAQAADRDGIRSVHRAAFDSDAEAVLVDALYDNDDVVLSLVAIRNGRIIGNVVYSRLLLDGAEVGATALAPVAVLARERRNGAGTALIQEAHRSLADAGGRLVLVLGDPDFYRRFGFSAQAAENFHTPYDGPYLMALKLGNDPAPMLGVITYAPAFAALT